MISGSPEKPVLGTKVAFIWGVLNIGCFLYVWFFIPELKGLQLEQVDELYSSESIVELTYRFEKKIPPRKSASWTPEVYYRESPQELNRMGSSDLKDLPTAAHREVA